MGVYTTELVLVRWKDATGPAKSVAEAGLVETITCGWLVHDTSEHADHDCVMVAQDTREDGTHSMVTTIPWGMVVNVRRLGKKRF